MPKTTAAIVSTTDKVMTARPIQVATVSLIELSLDTIAKPKKTIPERNPSSIWLAMSTPNAHRIMMDIRRNMCGLT